MTREQQAINLRESALIHRAHDLDMAHRFELRAVGVEQSAPLPELHGYVELCQHCQGDGWNMRLDGPVVCYPCRGKGEFGSPQFTSGEAP